MKTKIIVLFWIIPLIMPISAFGEKMTDNWRLTGYTKYRDAVFADMARLASPAPFTRSVWIKIAPSPKSKYSRFIHEYLQAQRVRNQGFKSIEIRCEIHCTSHLIRFAEFVYLDNDRKILHQAFERNPRWLQIIQGSIWYPVENAACTNKLK